MIILRSVRLSGSAISRLRSTIRWLSSVSRLSWLGSWHIGCRQLRLDVRRDKILAACAKSNHNSNINSNNNDTDDDTGNSRTNLLSLANTKTISVFRLRHIAIATSASVLRCRYHWIHTMTNFKRNGRRNIPLFRIYEWFIIGRIITTHIGIKTSSICHTSIKCIRISIN